MSKKMEDFVSSCIALVVILGIIAIISAIAVGPILWNEGGIGRPIRIGAVWVDSSEDLNPFKEHKTNTVINAKDGYVLYQNQKGEFGTCNNAYFRRNNTKVSDPPKPKPLVEDNR